MREPKIGEKNKPPYSICWPSLTTDVGTVEQKSRVIDVRHANGYLIIPGMVYSGLHDKKGYRSPGTKTHICRPLLVLS